MRLSHRIPATNQPYEGTAYKVFRTDGENICGVYFSHRAPVYAPRLSDPIPVGEWLQVLWGDGFHMFFDLADAVRWGRHHVGDGPDGELAPYIVIAVQYRDPIEIGTVTYVTVTETHGTYTHETVHVAAFTARHLFVPAWRTERDRTEKREGAD